MARTSVIQINHDQEPVNIFLLRREKYRRSTAMPYTHPIWIAFLSTPRSFNRE
ncbi:MAG: hypothetical protein ABFD70_08930 [Syntrophaceae bacterium]|nr:hypothetical protein [Deltaproteobacteria bacterium]